MAGNHDPKVVGCDQWSEVAEDVGGGSFSGGLRVGFNKIRQVQNKLERKQLTIAFTSVADRARNINSQAVRDSFNYNSCS